MNSKLPILEYSVAQGNRGRRAKWVFTFRNSEGETLIQSSMNFGSKAEAERKFIGLIKSIATNEYKVEYPQHSRNGAKSSRRLNGRCTGNPRKRVATSRWLGL